MPKKSACRAAPAPRPIACCLALAALLPLAGAQASHADLAALPLEELVSLEVYGASRFPQRVSEAPSAVTVLSAADIKAFGWRTLADILRSVRGLYVTSDRNYSYLGSSGFLRPGDYNSRFLLLVDGNRINDNLYDQAAIGEDFAVDVDLIDRVEFVPGPGSSVYGSNALFGVINVITRRGRDLPGAQVGVEAGSGGTRKARVSVGWHDPATASELLLAATAIDSAGRDLYFAEFDDPATNHGIAHGLDAERSMKLSARGAAGPITFSLAHVDRTKGIPTASFSQVFNDPRARTIDSRDYLSIAYQTALANDSELNARAYWGSADYSGDYIYRRPALTVNRDGSHGRWWGGELKLVTTRFAGQKIVAGMEYQNDYRRDQYNYDLPPPYMAAAHGGVAAALPPVFDQHSGRRAGIFAQDEISLRRDLLLSAGLRYDHATGDDGIFSPRLALIWQATSATTLKAMYGTAFRSPNAYESYYAVSGPGGQKANPGLDAERIRSRELVLEHFLATDTRLTASAFYNTVTGLITQTIDADGLLVFRNLDRATAQGVGLELERNWRGGARLRTSLTVQTARDPQTGQQLVNAPRQLGKFNLALPVAGPWRVGAEAQYIGRRRTLQYETGGYWLANLTLSSVQLAGHLGVAASVYNLFDRRYADPGSEAHVQDAIVQDGRAFRVRLNYAF